jgi:Mn2+/Fe2+ NRAMP family transporter
VRYPPVAVVLEQAHQSFADGLSMNFFGIDPIKALVVTAIINGIVAPPILVLIALLARDRKVMGERRSGRWSNTLVWAATVVMGVAAVALLVTLF